MSAMPEELAARAGHDDSAPRWLRLGPWALGALTLACGLAANFFYVLNHDVSYLLYIAGRILQGATLYVDLPEINPPLIVWLNMPVAWLAQALGVPDPQVLRVLLLALGCAVVAWSGAILRGWLARPMLVAWLVAALYVVMLLPGYAFGQREHIALMCALPYMGEAARRVDGQPVGRAMHFGVAALASLGMAIKPHFLLVALLVEAFAWWRQRRLAPGCLLAAALLLAYLGAVLLFAPGYRDMLRLLAGGYWANSGWLVFLRQPYFYATLVLLGLAAASRVDARTLPRVLLLASAGFAAAALIQHKGWPYHWLPALSLAWLAFALGIAQATRQRHWQGHALAPLIVSTAVALASLLALAVAVSKGRVSNPNPSQLAPLIRELGGGPVIVFSNFEASFPLVTEPGIGSSTRFPTMTIVGAMEQGGNAASIAWVRRTFAEDFYRKPPRLLLIETREDGRPIVDFVAYFGRDVPELQQYRLVRRTPRFMVLAAPREIW